VSIFIPLPIPPPAPGNLPPFVPVPRTGAVFVVSVSVSFVFSVFSGLSCLSILIIVITNLIR